MGNTGRGHDAGNVAGQHVYGRSDIQLAIAGGKIGAGVQGRVIVVCQVCGGVQQQGAQGGGLGIAFGIPPAGHAW